MKSRLLDILCFVVLCITLSLGLWPFHSPKNSVTWLKGANGIALGKYGTVSSRSTLNVAGSHHEASGSIEMWLQPDRWSGSATILSLYNPEKNLLFTLHQSLTRLGLRAIAGNQNSHFQVDETLGPALRQKKPVFVTITSSVPGTVVYLDGAQAKFAPQFRIPDGAFLGRIIVGDSPNQPDSFRGQIRGLAIYDTRLTASQVLRHYQTWTQNGQPVIAADERNIALYLFNEKAGDTIRNHAAEGGDLYIPGKYMVVDKLALEPIWSEFDFSRSYWSGNFKNIVGFIPFGFCFYAYFMVARRIKRAVLVTVILGAVVGLTIEVFQAFLPMRDSGTTDILTNALGTYLGVLCFKNFYPAFARRLPWIQWLIAPLDEVTEVLPGAR